MGNPVFLDFDTQESKHTWFIAWIGSVNESISLGSAKIDVLLYPLVGNIKGKFDGSLSQLDLKGFKIKSIEVGLLALISPGQLIYKDKIISDASKYQSISDFTIDISKDYVFLTRPVKDFSINTRDRENESGDKYQIYTMDFPLVKNQNSKCLCIPREIHRSEKYDFVVIPCIELVRFYFCTSDRMAQALFTGGLHDDKNELFDKKFITSVNEIEEGKTPHVTLELRTLESDAHVIGRIAYSQEAMKAARSVYNVIRVEKMNNKFINPTCSFPFSGKSDLRVCGKAIKALGKDDEFKDKKIFLVYNILTCSGSFPFKELDYNKKYSSEQGENKDDENLKKSGWNGNGRSQDDGDDKDPKLKSDEPGNSNPKRISIQELQTRFTNLPPVRKVKKEFQVSKADNSGLPEPPEPSSYTTNLETGNNPEVGKASISTIQPRDTKPDNPKLNEQTLHTQDEYEEYFRGLVEKFENAGKLSVDYISDDGSGYMHFYPNEFLNNPSKEENFKWACEKYTPKIKWNGKRPSLVVRLRDESIKKEFLLFDWVKRKTEATGGKILFLHTSDFSNISFHMITEVLKTCASNPRVWLHDYQMRELERELFCHYFDNGVDTVFEPLARLLNGNGFKIQISKTKLTIKHEDLNVGVKSESSLKSL